MSAAAEPLHGQFAQRQISEKAAGSDDATDATRLASQQDGIDSTTPAAPPVCHVAQIGSDYEHGINLFSAELFKRYRRSKTDPLYRPLRVYLTDPVASISSGGIAVVSVPYEQLDKGPVGSFLAVSGDDSIVGAPAELADLDNPAALLGQGFRPSTTDRLFHQQMVYAVCSEVAAAFTGALGRDLSWGFASGVLKLLPHCADERNAYYDPQTGQLRFGYFKADAVPGAGVLPRGTIYTCLSHDIIAHEMTHAVLDGMRSRFHEPSNPDVLAFHEGFADLIAILLHFSHVDAVRDAILRSAGKIETDPTIFSLAKQFGEATGMNGPLRTAFGTRSGQMPVYDPSMEPHDLGCVLVGAMLDAFSTVFERRAASIKSLIAAYRRANAPLHPTEVELLAKIATRTAEQFLALCIRAIDYCPPVDIRFGEFLRALVTADHDLVEDDRDGFRPALIAAFSHRKIFPDDVPDLSEDSLLWCTPDAPLPVIPGLSFETLQLRPDPGESPPRAEIEREAGALADVVTDQRFLHTFGLSSDISKGLPTVESVRIIRRIGPDRQVRFGLVCEVLQKVRVASGGTTTDMFGGSTIILDSAGAIRFVIRKAAREGRAAASLRFGQTAQGTRQMERYAARKTWATLCRCSIQR